MSVYARSDLAAITVSEAHGGCNKVHSRPAPGGIPVQPWKLDCADGCEDFLRHDPLWAATPADIPENHDEERTRLDFDKRGAKDKDAILTLALARLAGIPSSELPDSLTRMISGVPAHVPVAGQMVCPSGHQQPPGMKFCGECGAPMSRPVTAAALESPQPAADAPPKGPAPKRLRDAPLAVLQPLARAHGLDDAGTRADLVSRLAGANVTTNDMLAFLAVAA